MNRDTEVIVSASEPGHPDDGHDHWFACIRCGVDNGLNAAAQADTTGLRRALERFGQHTNTCRAQMTGKDEADCNCGLRTALAADSEGAK